MQARYRLSVGLLAIVTVFCAPAAATDIVFLDRAAAAKAILDDTHDPYFDLLESSEMLAKTGAKLEGDLDERRAAVREIYREGVGEFTPEEKQTLQAGIARLQPLLDEHYPLVAETPWSFLKVQDKIESGLPHTRAGHIILSSLGVRMMTGDGETAELGLATLLLHEQIHVVQRLHPEVFHPLYTDEWGFAAVDGPVEDSWLRRHQVRNPDGTDFWLFPIGENDDRTWIWPTLILDPSTLGNRPPLLLRDLRIVAFEVDRNRERFRIRKSENGKRQFKDAHGVEDFAGAFPFARAPYHPNEVSAEAFAAVVVEDLFADEPSAGTRSVRSWFRINLQGVATAP